MRRIALGAGAMSVVIIGVALAWSGMRPHLGFGPPPEIMAPATPLRVAPTDPGGLTVPEADVPIMSGASSTAPPQLAAQPPAPDISQLQAISGESPPAPAPSPPPPPASAPPPAHVLLNGPIEALLGTAPNQESSEKLWNQLNAEAPDLMQDRTPEYVPEVVNGQSEIRLSVGGFMNMQSAQSFCAALAEKGAACTAAAF
jgi:hypothetical protein